MVHEPGGGTDEGATVLATDVDHAEGPLEQAGGLMFRPSIPEDYALVFPFDRVRRRGIHTLFVRVPIDVVWLADGEVTHRKRLPAWRGLGMGRADTVVEFAAGVTAEVEVGDRIRVEE